MKNVLRQDFKRHSIYGILLPKLFWPTVGKNCSSDRENLLKFEAEGWEFAKILRSLEQVIHTVKSQNKLENILGFRNIQEKLEKNSVTKNCSDLSLFE